MSPLIAAEADDDCDAVTLGGVAVTIEIHGERSEASEKQKVRFALRLPAKTEPLIVALCVVTFVAGTVVGTGGS